VPDPSNVPPTRNSAVKTEPIGDGFQA